MVAGGGVGQDNGHGERTIGTRVDGGGQFTVVVEKAPTINIFEDAGAQLAELQEQKEEKAEA